MDIYWTQKLDERWTFVNAVKIEFIDGSFWGLGFQENEPGLRPVEHRRLTGRFMIRLICYAPYPLCTKIYMLFS